MRHRMHAICPYFAMFPEDFVEQHVSEYSSPGDYIFDPFSGRGTTVFQSLLMDREALGVDINPVAFCVSTAKTFIPKLGEVRREINKLEKEFNKNSRTELVNERKCLPEFFARAFYHSTLEQILFLRRHLRWKTSKLHCFIAALALGSLHGDRDVSPVYFSNQMPRTISTKPAYSVNFWKKHDLWPHKRDVFSILRNRAAFRLTENEVVKRGKIKLGDARKSSALLAEFRNSVKLVITSPPYFNVTSYEEDQWLRLWFLGHNPFPSVSRITKDDTYRSAEKYWAFLNEVWKGVSSLLSKDSVLVCRLGSLKLDEESLSDGIKKSVGSAFPNASFLKPPVKSDILKRQTGHFVPSTEGCKFEVDFVFGLNN